MKLVKSFATTCSSYHSPSILLTQTISVKIKQTIGLKTWNRLQVEVIACGISWSELEKALNLQGRSTKEPHSLGVLFLLLGFSKGVTHFYGITLVTTFAFSRISKTNLETSVEYLQRHFLSHPACFFSGPDQ